MHRRCCLLVTRITSRQHRRCIIPQSSAPEDGRNCRPKHVELIVIINKLLLLHLVWLFILLCKWWTASQISDKVVLGLEFQFVLHLHVCLNTMGMCSENGSSLWSPVKTDLKKLKLKVTCGAFSALQPVGRLYPCPQWVPLIHLQRRHAPHRHERPLLAKEETIQGILLAHS